MTGKEQAQADEAIRAKKSLSNMVAKRMGNIFATCLNLVELAYPDVIKADSEKYTKLRGQILNAGNEQIREAQSDLERFKVMFERFTIEMPVKPKEGNGGE